MPIHGVQEEVLLPVTAALRWQMTPGRGAGILGGMVGSSTKCGPRVTRQRAKPWLTPRPVGDHFRRRGVSQGQGHESKEKELKAGSHRTTNWLNIAGTVAAMTESEPGVESERVSHNAPVLTGTAPRGGPGVWVSSWE